MKLKREGRSAVRKPPWQASCARQLQKHLPEELPRKQLCSALVCHALPHDWASHVLLAMLLRVLCRFTALALGMILSLLSAIPIYKVCRLYECAHPGPSSTAIAAKA